jgi:hypothetical protein
MGLLIVKPVIVCRYGILMLASGTRVRGFKPGRSRRIFSGEKILSMPSFGREVKSQICGMLKNRVITWMLGHRQNQSAIYRPIVPPFATRSARVDDVRESGGEGEAGESNGKIPLRTCLERSVPEPYRSTDWALVPAKPAQRLNTTTNNKFT